MIDQMKGALPVKPYCRSIRRTLGSLEQEFAAIEDGRGFASDSAGPQTTSRPRRCRAIGMPTGVGPPRLQSLCLEFRSEGMAPES